MLTWESVFEKRTNSLHRFVHCFYHSVALRWQEFIKGRGYKFRVPQLVILFVVILGQLDRSYFID